MPIYSAHKKGKLYLGATKVRKAYLGSTKVYSSGNVCTYIVDSGISYREEFDEGESVLSPKTFTPAKSGWTFVGWRTDTAASSAVQTSMTMGDSPVTLYAVFRQTITVTYYNGSTTASSVVRDRYYNNGTILNPSFSLSQAAISGWSARGWSGSPTANGSILYANGATFTRDSNIAVYGAYQQTVTLSYSGNGNTGGATAAQTGIRYWNTGNVLNPTFTLQPNGFTNQWANFSKWALGSAGGAQYAAGSSVTLETNTTFYAIWTTPSSIDLISSGVVRISPTAVAPASFTPGHGQSHISVNIGMQQPNQDYSHYGFCVYGHIPNPRDMQYPSATITWSGLPENYKKATIELITSSNGWRINSQGHMALNNNSVKLYEGAFSTGETKFNTYTGNVSATDGNQKTLKLTCLSGNVGDDSSGYSYFMIKKLTLST